MRRERDEDIRSAIDGARAGTFDWDVVHGRIAWSSWHDRLWGYASGEFDGTYAGLVDRVTLTAVLVDGAAAVRLSVADTGIGIQPEDLATLFQPFRQLDSGLTRRHDGTGLGMAICRRLAALLGGEIGVTSTWGRGSEFTVTFPHRQDGP